MVPLLLVSATGWPAGRVVMPVAPALAVRLRSTSAVAALEAVAGVRPLAVIAALSRAVRVADGWSIQ